MSIKIGNYEFEGPFTALESIKNVSGVYVILCKNEERKYKVIDVGESGSLVDRLSNHDREECWKKNCKNVYEIAIYYTIGKVETERKKIEQELRDLYNPVCGIR